MTDGNASHSMRFALFASGARFSCAVFDQLIFMDCLPDLLVVPQYPPADTKPGIVEVQSASDFLSRTNDTDIELLHAPREWQSRCAVTIRDRNIDFILIACWPYLIEPVLYTSSKQATLNMHPSRLPRYRGANPLQQQIAAVDLNCGVSLHLLNDQFDRGDIVKQAEFEAKPNAFNLESIEQHCAKVGVEMFIEVMASGQANWRSRQRPDQASETD